MATQISGFTKSGKKVNATRRAGVATSPLGTYDPNTGFVWQRPRIKLDKISGPRVRVTNPKAMSPASELLTQSIGAKGAGQRGRNRDVGSAKAPGESNT